MTAHATAAPCRRCGFTLSAHADGYCPVRTPAGAAPTRYVAEELAPEPPDMEARIREALVAIVGHDEECDRLYDETDPCGCTNRLTTPEEVRGLNVLRDLLRESEAKIAALRSSVVSESGKAWEAAERRWEESEARYVARIEEAERKLAEAQARRQEAEEKASGMAALLYSSKPLVVLRDRLAAAEKERDEVTLKLAAARRVFAETADSALASDRASAQVIESLTAAAQRANGYVLATEASLPTRPNVVSTDVEFVREALLAAQAWLDGR